MIAAGFANGHIIDIILLMVLLEAVLIWLWRRSTGRGPALASVFPVLGSGFLLLLAVRAALVQAPWPLVALPLTAALFTHILDLALRWRR
jgi:hypothetical protein